MLVEFYKGFIMEGENTITERKYFWSRPESRRQKIYCTAGVHGICDESELDEKIKEGIEKCLASSGWGKEFSGWQRVLTYEESVEVSEREGWGKMYTNHYLPTTEITLKYLDDWTVEKAAKELNGRQFAQYCRDFGIPCYNK